MHDVDRETARYGVFGAARGDGLAAGHCAWKD
jgi:hypothetical protein